MPTSREIARYNFYRLLMALCDLEPRSPQDWLVTYYQMERRRKRREKYRQKERSEGAK